MRMGKGMRGWALAAAMLLALVGCEGVTPVTDGDGSESAGLDFTLTSFARSGGSTASTAGAGRLAGGGSQVQVDGELLVVPSAGATRLYTWALLVDELGFQINTSITLNLDPGDYNFRFLMNAGGLQYAGSTLNRVILEAGSGSASNRIPFTLVPVLVEGAITAGDVAGLGELQLHYDAAEIRSYTEPAFSLSVNGGPAPLFSVNPGADTPTLSVLMAPGTHHVELRIYDGTLLKLVAEYDVTIEAGGVAEIDVQPLVSEVTYNYQPGPTPDEDTGNVTFLVPGAIVAEAGGVDQLLASAAVVGPLTPLVEQDLLLAPDVNTTSSYSASMEVPGLTAGGLTWALQFRRKDGTLYAYCAQSVVIPEPADTEPLTGSFLCAPRMVVQGVTAATPVSPLTLDVKDPDGAVPGAVVKANTEPLGITSAGDVTGGVTGQLGSFLPAGFYGVLAEQKLPDPQDPGALITRTSQEELVALADGTPAAVTLNLEGLTLPPPPEDDNQPAGDFIELTASRQSSPLRFHDEFVHLSGWAKIRVPQAEEVQLLQGDPQRYLVVLSFGRRDLRCWYLGGDWDAEVTGWLDDLVQNTFSNPVCTRGTSAGDVLTVHGPVRMRVVGGSRQYQVTQVRLDLEVVDVDAATGQGNRERPDHWQGTGFWNWWGWWRDQGHDRDSRN